MEITLIDWLKFLAAVVYLFILPGANVIRTIGWAGKLRNPVELLVVAFGISLAITVLVTLALALSFSVGVNFYTLMILETLVIIATSREVVRAAGRLIRGARSGA